MLAQLKPDPGSAKAPHQMVAACLGLERAASEEGRPAAWWSPAWVIAVQRVRKSQTQSAEEDTMVPVHPEAGAAVTGPRVSESASSDGGCGLEAGESCVGERVFDRTVAASLGDSSS